VQTLVSGRHRHGRAINRLGRPMLAAQVAFAIILVFGAGIATRAFVHVLRTPLGFNPENVMKVSVSPPRGTANLPEFYRRVLDTLARRPDVIAAGAAGAVPLGGAGFWSSITRPESKRRVAGVVHALPGYFPAAGIDLVRGRLLTWDDGVGAPGTVLSESAARALFPDVDPLGQVLDSGSGESWRVVGIVRDVRSSLDRESEPPVYVIPTGRTTVMPVLARMRGRHEAARTDVRRELALAVPDAFLISTGWWTDSIHGLTAFKNPRFQTLVLTSFAAMALAVTALGVFGVVTFLVATRTREMGIRVAVGASAGSLVGLIVRQALWPVVVGLLVGLLATRWAAQLAHAQLFEVETDDPVTLGLAVVVVLVAALIAAYLPARRASRIDPLIVLRAE
jgi:predicted permease